MIDFKALGLNVIPCKPKSKLPAIPWKEYQHNQYTGQLAENNAVICGVSSHNLVVIDLDDKTLAQTIFGDFDYIKKTTLVVETNKGYHIYVRPKGLLPNTMRVNHSDGRHIDVQSQGAYVVAPGSIHPDSGKPYQVISETTQIREIDLDGFLNGLSEKGFRGVNEGLPPIKELVNGVTEGNRNNATFKYAAHLIGVLDLPDDMVMAEINRWASMLKFTPRPGELESVVKSALSRVKRPITKPPEYQPGKILKLRDLNSGFENQEVEFGAYIVSIGERTTVSTKLEVMCPNCKVVDNVDGRGYVNPKIPKCERCKVRMETTKILDTVDMKEVYLQELPEDTNYDNPNYFVARVIGANIFKIAINSRKKFKAKFKSFTGTSKGKTHNDVVLLVSEVDDLEESEDAIYTAEEQGKYKTMSDSNPTAFMDKLIDSYHPDIVGHRRIKEALLLSAAGGSECTTKRTLIHVGLVGNKSKAKSRLLKKHAALTGGSYVVGMNTTKAGLGIGIIKLPDGTSIPKPGVLVMKSGRSVSLDEADKAHPDDLKSLNECMEQETVTNAKATAAGEQMLPAKTAIILGANFKFGDWDEDAGGIKENLNLQDNFISRLALIFRILNYDDLTNQKIADKILALTTDEKPLFDEQGLRVYLNTVKRLKPGLTQEAKVAIKGFFLKMSKKESVKDLSMEVRQLEDFVRLATARAKLLQKQNADSEDVMAVIDLYRASLASWGIDIESGTMQLKLQSEEQTKEQTLMELVHAAKDANGNFSMDAVTEKWSKTKWFSDKRDAINQFNRWVPERFLLNRDGLYYVSHGY